MKNFKDRIALITGGASGMGHATALELARRGAHIVIADVNETGALQAAEEIQSLGRQALTARTDVSRPEEVKELSRKVFRDFGRVDILMNCAGVGLMAEIKDTTLPDWDWIMRINFWGSVHTLHYFLPRMVEQREGHIINIASFAGVFGAPATGAYAASKFALVGLSEVLRTELERFGIGVTAVCPGLVRTPILESIRLRGFSADANKFPALISVSPERAAKKIVRAVRRNRALLVFTFYAVAVYHARRLSPALGRKIARLMFVYFLRFKN